MKRFIMTVEGPNLSDVSEIELPALPSEGEPIETRFGTCIVSSVEDRLTDDGVYQGKIVCRMP
ncbi:MAG TPA: hypothetical protein VGH82_07095 [Gaiellaceae bacterium]|jgi:hypothetical protein